MEEIDNRKRELLAFLMLMDKERATPSFVDSLFEHNDFATVRSLMKLTYRAVPRGWANLRPDGTPQQQGGAIVWSRNDTLDVNDPTHGTWQVLTTSLACLLVFGATFAAFAPYWMYFGVSATPYGRTETASASLWFLHGPDRQGRPSVMYLSDCPAGTPARGFVCGMQYAAQAFSIQTICAALVCVQFSALKMEVTDGYSRISGGAVVSFLSLVTFGLYFGTALHEGANISGSLCDLARQTLATCDLDVYSVSFWMMVSLFPFGWLHVYVMHVRYRVFFSLKVLGTVDGFDEMDRRFRLISKGLGIICACFLITGIALGALDATIIGSIKSQAYPPNSLDRIPSVLYHTSVATRVTLGLFGFFAMNLSVFLGMIWAMQNCIPTARNVMVPAQATFVLEAVTV